MPSSITSDVIKGHFLLFEKPFEKLTEKRQIIQTGVAFLLSGVILLTVLRAVSSLLTDGEDPILGAMPARFGTVVLLLIGTFAIVKMLNRDQWAAQILRPLKSWTRREYFYLLQVVPTASITFAFVFGEKINELIGQHGLVGFLVFNVLFGLVWGIYQEVTYRGLLQGVTVSKFGTVAGILIATLIFTFGPLHFSHYPGLVEDPSRAMIFIPIFGIGLVFGIVYHRSGNIWLPAILHGLWPLNW